MWTYLVEPDARYLSKPGEVVFRFHKSRSTDNIEMERKTPITSKI